MHDGVLAHQVQMLGVRICAVISFQMRKQAGEKRGTWEQRGEVTESCGVKLSFTIAWKTFSLKE